MKMGNQNKTLRHTTNTPIIKIDLNYFNIIYSKYWIPIFMGKPRCCFSFIL